jgi:HEAT repeat protein
MEYANKKGVIVHRDIKPGNIMVTMQKVIKVNDFGLAKAIESVEKTMPHAESEAALDSKSIDVSRGMGTLSYMAPEQFPKCLLDYLRTPSPPLGTEADIYAFGLVLYEMITGKPVIKIVSETEMEIQREADQIASHEFTLPNGTRTHFPPKYLYCFLKALKFTPSNPSRNERLNAVIRRCLKKDPSKRYHSFTELREELMQIYREETGKDFRVVEEPPHLPNWRNMGKTYWVLGREKESSEYYDKALEQNPTDTLIWLEKGLAAAEIGDLGEFGLCMEIILHLKPNKRLEAEEYKELILNEPKIRLRDVRLLENIALETHVSDQIRDWVSSHVEQKIGDPFHEPNPAISRLIEKLTGPDDVPTRFSALQSLSKLGDISAVPPLIKTLKNDAKTSMRQHAANSLGRFGDKRAVPALIGALKDTDASSEAYSVAHIAAQSLGDLGDVAAVPPLIEIVKQGKFDSLWEQAAKALGKLGDPSAIPVLIEMFRKAEDEFGIEKRIRIRVCATMALGNLGGESARLALKELLKNDSSLQVKGTLAKLGDESAIQTIIERLKKGKDHHERFNAARTLIGLGNKSVLPALIKALEKDKDSSVRVIVAQGLAKFPDSSSTKTLRTALKKDKNEEVRLKAALTLGEMGDRSAVPTLIEALKKSQDPSRRIIIVGVLGELGDKSAVPALVEALNVDEDLTVRGHVARELGELGDTSTVPALINALKRNHSSVRTRAVEALARGDTSAIPVLIESLKNEPELQRITKNILASGKASAISLMIESERRQSYFPREGAAEALGKLGDRSAVTPLIDTLNKETHYSLRKASAKALGELGDESAIPSLIEAIKDESSSVREEVSEALAKLANNQTILSLLDAWSQFPNPSYVVVALRWVRSQPERTKLFQIKEKLTGIQHT